MNIASASPVNTSRDADQSSRLVESINEAWDARDTLIDLLGGDKTQALRDQFVRLGEIRWHLDQALRHAQPSSSTPQYTSVARALERQAKKPTISARDSEQGLTEAIHLQLERMIEAARNARDAIDLLVHDRDKPSLESTLGVTRNKIRKHLDSAVFHIQRLTEAADLLSDDAD